MTIIVALAWRASLMAVAREGMTVSGRRRRWYASSRSSLETTMRPGLLSSSAMASAKLSPTQLYSARLEVFSNGSTITTSPAGFCAWTAGKTMVVKRSALINLRLINLISRSLNYEDTITQRPQRSRRYPFCGLHRVDDRQFVFRVGVESDIGLGVAIGVLCQK